MYAFTSATTVAAIDCIIQGKIISMRITSIIVAVSSIKVGITYENEKKYRTSFRRSPRFLVLYMIQKSLLERTLTLCTCRITGSTGTILVCQTF